MYACFTCLQMYAYIHNARFCAFYSFGFAGVHFSHHVCTYVVSYTYFFLHMLTYVHEPM
jgi:hypothetical protein